MSSYFSVDDLYDLLTDHGPWTPQAMFLVHPHGTWAALRSQESDWLSPVCRQEDFAWFWNWQRPEHERRAVNLAIAQCHHLVLYEGGIDQPLSRVFPPSRIGH